MWNLKPNDRLKRWREIRDGLSMLSLDQALIETVHLWSYAPFVNYYLSPDNNPQWPDPWTILHENYYCDIAKALGMLYTIYFTNHRDELSIEFRIYFDPATKNTYNLVWINDGKYVLNFEHDEIVNKEHIEESFKLKYKYDASALKLDQY